MYNINMYTYQKEPFTKTRRYGIHPLDDPGLDTYTGPESHCVNYLYRTNPKVFRHIIHTDYETIMNQQKELIDTKKKVKIEENKNQTEEPVRPYLQTEVNQSTHQEEVPKQTLTNEKQGDLFNRTMGTGYYPSHTENVSNCLIPRINSTRQIQYHKRRNFKDTYGYDKLTELKTNKERCLNEIKDLKSMKLSNDEFNYTHSGFYFPKKRYSGFTSYAVPRTRSHSKASSAFKTYEEKIRRSMDCFSKKVDAKNEFEILQKDNEDMKMKLKTMTNEHFLEKVKLPDVATLANSRKKIRNIKIGNSKEMGERYNPYCMMTKTGDLVGRNFVGALFNH